MTTQDLARTFAALLKEGKADEAAALYNADDIVSHENMDGPMAVCRGKDAVKAKGDWWAANHDIHAFTTEGPYVNGDQFALTFFVDVTVKGTGERRTMHEVGLYTVKHDRIVEERFFY